MSIRIETRWIDGKLHAIFNGQDCGPGVPCGEADFVMVKPRIEMLLRSVAEKSEEIGRSNAQAEMRRVLSSK